MLVAEAAIMNYMKGTTSQLVTVNVKHLLNFQLSARSVQKRYWMVNV